MKRLMKSIVSLFLIATLMASLAACGSGSASQETAATTEEAVAAQETEATQAEAAPEEASAEATRQYPDREPIYFWFWGAATDQQEHMKNVLCNWYNESQDTYELVLEFRSTVDADIPVALAAGEGPDIVYASGPATPPPMHRKGWCWI